MCGDRIASTVCTSLFVIALVASWKFSPNGTLVGLSLGFAVISAAFIFIEWFVFSPILQFVVLYYGVTIGAFSVYDIYDDLIKRTVDGSDAKACHELIPCCFPKCVGVQFAIIALCLQGLALYLALVWMGAK
jgi:hypothetical protein